MRERQQVDALEGVGGVKKAGGGWGTPDDYKQKVAELTEQRLSENANVQGGGISNTGVTGAGQGQFNGNEDGGSSRNNSQGQDAFFVSAQNTSSPEIPQAKQSKTDINPDEIRERQERRTQLLAQSDTTILRSLRG